MSGQASHALRIVIGLVFIVHFVALLFFSGNGSILRKRLNPLPKQGETESHDKVLESNFIIYIIFNKLCHDFQFSLALNIPMISENTNATTKPTTVITKPKNNSKFLLTDKEVASMKVLMKKRHSTMVKHCALMANQANKGKIVMREHSQTSFFLKNRNVKWCPVFKASSSTWLIHLFNYTTENAKQVNKN